MKSKFIRHLELPVGGQGRDEDLTASAWTPAYGRLEETQAYNLSLGASTHHLMVTVTSTRRASIVHIRSAKDHRRRSLRSEVLYTGALLPIHVL